MPTYADVCVRVRSLLDDFPAAVYTNAFLLPIVNQAQSVLASELESAGSSEVRSTIVYTGSTAIPAGLTNLVFSPAAGLPALPSNLIAPDRLLERRAALSPPTVTNSAGGGSITGGIHLCAVAFKGVYGTSVPMTTTSVTSSLGDTLLWTNIPIGPVGTTHRILLRSKAGGAVLYEDQTLADNTTTTATSTDADASLTVLASLTGPSVGPDESQWMPMRGSRPLPAATQQSQLVYWDWNGHTITFIGATEPRDVKMDYWATVSDFPTSGTDTTALPITDSLDFLAALTAGIAAQSRGQAQLASLYGVVDPTGVTGMAGRLLYNFINTTLKTAQSEPLRRAPYASIHRYPAYQTPFFKY